MRGVMAGVPRTEACQEEHTATPGRGGRTIFPPAGIEQIRTTYRRVCGVLTFLRTEAPATVKTLEALLASAEDAFLDALDTETDAARLAALAPAWLDHPRREARAMLLEYLSRPL